MVNQLKLPSQTIKVYRNGCLFQIDLDNPFVRYKGGGGGDVAAFDPYAGTGTRELFQQLNQWLGPQIGQGVTPYGGERVAGMDPLQQSAYGMAGGYAPGVQAGLQGFGQYQPQQGLGLLEAGVQGLQGAMQPFDPAGATELWETAWKQPALETWREDVMPSIMEKGVRSAGTADSGPMRRELARSGEKLTTDLSGQLANLLYSGQQAQAGRQMQGAGMLGQMSQIPGQLAGQGLGMAGQGLGQMAGMGGEQRGIGQQFLGAEQAQWQEAQPYNNPYLQNFLGLGLQSGVPQQGFIQEPGANPMGPMLGAGLGGLGGWMMGGGNLLGYGMANAPFAALGGPAGALGGAGLGALLGGYF